MRHPSVSSFPVLSHCPQRVLRICAAVWVGLVLGFAGVGCGGGGGGGGGESSPTPVSSEESTPLVVSGVVRDVSETGAARLARSDLPAIRDALISVWADRNGDGGKDPDTEVFTARSGEDGGFAVALPGDALGKAAEVRVEKRGYSTFVRRYTSLDGSITLDPVLSQGATVAVDLSGVSATPSRAGRIVLDTDRVVTVSLVRDRVSGRRSARVFWGDGAEPADTTGQELARVSFPLRGLNLPAGTERLYASVAYLDTANDPDAMPGGFRAEGQGETPVDVLSTYAASEITLTDELGNRLLTDPADRSRDVRIRIAIPQEAYETLRDEDPDTAEVEIPLYYYDEAAGLWRLHRNADGTPAYGHLEDAYGNVLTQTDLARLVAGEDTDTQVFGVGTVHHFTTWNCDRAGSSVSYHVNLRDRSGNPASGVSVRIRSRRGGRSSDYDRRANANLHAYRAETADAIIRRILDRSISPEERSRLLYAVMNSRNPEALTALIEALQRYEEEHYAEIAEMDSELARGFAAIFSHREITEAFIDTAGLDCSATPDLCRGAIAAAAEAINRSSKAKQVVALLMQIAVDAYNPSNLNFEYAATKGLEFLDVVVNADGVAKDLGDIPEQVKSAKDLARQALDAYRAYRNGTGSWDTYWNLAEQLRETMENIKNLATTLGGRLNRRAFRVAPLTPPSPQSAEEEAAAVEDITDEVLASYDELGGLLFGYSRMKRYRWGYYDAAGAFHPVDTWPGKPAFVGTGTVMMLEYYNGTDWVPLEGRSDQGVDASFIVVPSITSFGPGTPQAPAIYLGTWTLDLEPNVEVTGRIESAGGVPLADVPILVGGMELRSGPDGIVSGKIRWFSEETSVPYRMPDFWLSGTARLEGGIVDLGTVQVSDRITINYRAFSWWNLLRVGESLTIRPAEWAGTVSGRPVAAAYALYQGWIRDDSVPLDQAEGDAYTFTVDPDTPFGTYVLRVTLSVPGDDSVRPQYVDVGIQVRSTPPEIRAIELSAQEVKAGTPVKVVLDVTDADGDDDIQSKRVWARCQSDQGVGYPAVVRAEPDGSWTVPTDAMYTLLEGSVTCDVTAEVIDRSWMGAEDTARFTVLPNPVPPEVSWGGLEDEYVVSLGRVYGDAGVEVERADVYVAQRVGFTDRNRDLDHLELDCGNGEGPQVAADRIDLPPCRYTEPGDYSVTYRAVDAAGLESLLQTTVHVLYPLRIEISVPDDRLEDTGDGFVVNLPPVDDASVDVSVQVVSDNGPEGYAEGGGTIEEGYYSISYRSGNLWWWSESLANHEPLPPDGQIPLQLDRPGRYTVFVWARDSRGMIASFSRVFDVVAPFDGDLAINGMTVDAFTRSGGWVLAGEPVTFSVVNLSAPEGAEMRYRWYVDDRDMGETWNPSYTYTPDRSGEHTVRVEMRNLQETSDAHTVIRRLAFQVYAPFTPTLSRTDDPESTTARAGDLVTFSVSVPEGIEVSTVRWAVSGPAGGFRPVPTDTPTQASWTFVEAGSYTISAAVEDSRGVQASVDFGPLVVTAEPPVIASLTATPDSGRPPLTVTFEVRAEDPDARPGEELRYRWFVDGEPVAAGTESSYSHTFRVEGVHRVRVEAMDAGGLTATATVTVVVQDRPPVITSVEVAPGSGVAPLQVTASVRATDDGRITGYEWSVDGRVIGTDSSVTHTFDKPGTYTLEVAVTDEAGNTTRKGVTVYVWDPDAAAIAFELRELRADGPGPLADLVEVSEFLGHGGGIWFVRTEDPTVDPEDLVTLSNTLEFSGPAFYGTHLERWGSVTDALVWISAPGTYPTGVVYWKETLRTVQFPRAFTCGVLAYGAWPVTFGIWSPVDSPIDSYTIAPSMGSMDSDGNVDVLVVLGDRNEETGACTYDYVGFVRSAEDTVVFGEENAVPLKPVDIEMPEGLDLRLWGVTVVRDGVEIGFTDTDYLPWDDQGRLLLPVVSGADYELAFRVSVSGQSWNVTVPLSADTVEGAPGSVPVDLRGLLVRDPWELVSAPRGTLVPSIEGTTGIRTTSSVFIGEGATAGPPVLGMEDEETIGLYFDGTAGQNEGAGFYRSWSADQLPEPLDFSDPDTEVDVTAPEIDVDTENHTLRVTYQTSGADACVIGIFVEFENYRSRWAYFLTDGSVTDLTLAYPLPEVTVTYPDGSGEEVYPAVDAIERARVRVTCMTLSGGYDAFVRELLERGSLATEEPAWSPDALVKSPSVEQIVWALSAWPVEP